jgi:multidrug efflux pump subunit AcrB
MSSVSASDGTYTLTVTFDVGTELDTSLALVQNLANGAVSQLPGGAQAQGVNVRKVSPNILLVASLYSDDDRFEEIFLSNYALINLQNPLARLPGVGQVRIFGAGPYSMRVWLDPKRLQSFGITTADVLTAIQGQNVQVVAGRLGAPRCRTLNPFSSRSTPSAGFPTPASSSRSSSRTRPARPTSGATARRRPGGPEPAELQQFLEIQRAQVGPDRDVRPAGRQRHSGRQ